MDWQTVAALVLVGLVAALLLRWKWRDLRRELTTGCSGGCSCSQLPAREQRASSLAKTTSESYLGTKR